jgi:NADH-quinone oxidoreductase subunit M
MSEMPLLSLAIWTPIASGLLVLATGPDRNAPLARTLALLGAIVGFLITIPLYSGFDVTTPAMQFVEELAPWIDSFNINYNLGVDGISMLFIILNSFITVIVVLAGWNVIDNKVAQYNAAFLIMSGLLNGIFARWTVCCFMSFLRHH